MTDRLGKRLRKARNEAGLSLRALEKICGVSFSNLARIERGVGECLPAIRLRVEKWLETGEGSAPIVRSPSQKSWYQNIEARLIALEEWRSREDKSHD
jgi:transcriptional regulator with XRE-family HTH domain